MKRIDLNFAIEQRQTGRRQNALGIVVLLLSIGLSGWLLWKQHATSVEKDLLETKVEQLRRTSIKATHGGEVIPDVLAQEIRFANDALSQVPMPWEELFKALESAKDDRIALIALQPNAQKREIRISGEAQDFDALILYRDKLAAERVLSNIQLMTHQIVAHPTRQPVKFDLIASWNMPV